MRRENDRPLSNGQIEEMLKNSRELTPGEELKARVLQNAAQASVCKPSDAEAAPQNARKAILLRQPAFLRVCAVAAAMLLLFALSITAVLGTERDIVYLDVNPSVELSLTRTGKVRAVTYLNEDAENALSRLSLKGTEAEDALERILSALDEQGYLTNAEINISVYSGNERRGDSLLSQMKEEANAYNQQNHCGATVNSSRISEEEKQEAKENGISPGKLKPIKEIMALTDAYSQEELSKLSMRELKALLEALQREQDTSDQGSEADETETLEQTDEIEESSETAASDDTVETEETVAPDETVETEETVASDETVEPDTTDDPNGSTRPDGPHWNWGDWSPWGDWSDWFDWREWDGWDDWKAWFDQYNKEHNDQKKD